MNFAKHILDHKRFIEYITYRIRIEVTLFSEWPYNALDFTRSGSIMDSCTCSHSRLRSLEYSFEASSGVGHAWPMQEFKITASIFDVRQSLSGQIALLIHLVSSPLLENIVVYNTLLGLKTCTARSIIVPSWDIAIPR